MTALDICLCQEFQGHFCFRHICNLEQSTARSRKLQRAGWILCPRGTASRLSQVHPSRYLHRQLQFLILSSLVPALSWVLVECTGQLPLEMTDTRHKDPFLSYWETLSFFNGEGTQKWRRERSDCVLHPQPSEKGEVLVPQSCPTLRPHALKPTRFPHLWDSPGKSTGVDCHTLFQGIFPTQVSRIAGGVFTVWGSREAHPQPNCSLFFNWVTTDGRGEVP